MDAGVGGGTAESAVVAIGRVDPALLGKPLDYLDAERSRLVAALGLLDNIAGGRSGAWRRLVRVFVEYLSTDFGHHLSDESDLLDILLDDGREDALAPGLIGYLRRHHVDAQVSANELRRTLELCLHVDAPATHAEAVLAAAGFLVAQRARLEIEAECLMPVARARLGPQERRRLARRMRARRAAV